jgi:hypothetical protein
VNSLFVEAQKTHQQTYEQQRAQFADAVDGHSLRAAQTSAKAAQMAAVAALLAAAGSIGQLIVAVIAAAVK